MNIKIVAAGFAVASLALVGCSSDSSDSSASPTPATTSAAPMESPTDVASPVADETIVGVASANPDFSTLVAAVSAAGLAETLGAPGPYTVFAPTNEAFEDLPAGLLDALLLPENKEILAQILTYHVVAGEVMSADVQPGKVPTVEGSDLTIKVQKDGDVKVNGADVEAVDVEASNGVIHVIDEVLVPPNVDVNALLS